MTKPTVAERRKWWASLTKEQQEAYASNKIAERKAKQLIEHLDAEFRGIVQAR